MTYTEPPFISRPIGVSSQNGRWDPLPRLLSSRPRERILTSFRTELSETRRDPGVMKWNPVLTKAQARSDMCVEEKTAVPSGPPDLDLLPRKSGLVIGTPST